MNVRDMFTEHERHLTDHERHLTDHMPELVAVGYVNARRKNGRGDKARHRLVVTGSNVTELPGSGSLDGFNLGDIFGGFGRRR